MHKFGKVSKLRLATCHPDLQVLMNEAIKYIDFSVLCGHRTEREQNRALASGTSTKKWPESKHNKLPSLAVDIAPYPVDWEDTARFARLAGYIERIADEKGIKIRWGGDWNDNFRTLDERLIDMPHIELM